jgi:hypothetical protein
MKKWLVTVMSALFLAALLSVPSGCGPGEATKIESKGNAPPPPPGHAEAAKRMREKPADAK